MNCCSNPSMKLVLVVGLLCGLRTSVAEDAGQVDRFKIYNDGDFLLVPVEVEGKRHLFVVDTGVTKTVFDSSLLAGRAIGDYKIQSTTTIVSGQQFETPPSRLRNHDLKALIPSVFGFDLTPFREGSGDNIMGIIGMDFLRDFIVEIDFDAGEMVFHDYHSEIQKSTLAIPMGWDKGNTRTVRAEIPGWGYEDFGIDTGHCGGCIGSLRKQIIDYRDANMRTIGEQHSRNAAGDFTSRTVRGPMFELGGNQVRQPMFAEGNKSFLGLHFLSRFHVIMDFPNRQLYLRKGKTFEKPDLRDLSGIHFLKKNNQIVVNSIDAGSTGEKSGMQAGDVILKVDGQDADKARPFTVRQLLSQDGKVVKLAIQRGKELIDVTLELKDVPLEI